MFPRFDDQLEILWLSLRHSALTLVFVLLQAAAMLLVFLHPPIASSPYLAWLVNLPWYGWVIGWLAVLWLCTMRYSADRKKRFDLASANFFKAYLEHLIKEGSLIFQHAGEPGFYSRINDWQRKAVQGIAIGLGPEQSKEFFQKVETKSPLSEAYRQAVASKTDEPLSKSLEARLEELNHIRLSLPEKEEETGKELQLGGSPSSQRVPVQPAALLTGEVEPPPSKRLPKK